MIISRVEVCTELLKPKNSDIAIDPVQSMVCMGGCVSLKNPLQNSLIEEYSSKLVWPGKAEIKYKQKMHKEPMEMIEDFKTL